MTSVGNPSSSSNLRSVAAVGTAIAGVAIGVYIAVRAHTNANNANKPKSATACCKSSKMGGCQTTPSSAAPASSTPYAVPPANTNTNTNTNATANGTAAGVVASPLTIDDGSSPVDLTREPSIMPRLVNARINPDADHPLILIVCGPSGVGKGTLLHMLRAAFPSSFAKSVSHTTRAPRHGEVHAKHYHFTTKQQMEADIAANQFLEHAKVHDNYYGTSLMAVREVQESKKIPILEVDIQGAHTIHHHPEFKDASKKPLVLFVLPPRFDSLHSRLSGRGSETPSTLNTRLQTAKVELKRLADCEFCDIAIMNDNLDTAFLELVTSLVRVYPHLERELPEAQYQTSLLYRTGVDKVLLRNDRVADEWLTRAKNGGHTKAAAELAALTSSASAPASSS